MFFSPSPFLVGCQGKPHGRHFFGGCPIFTQTHLLHCHPLAWNLTRRGVCPSCRFFMAVFLGTPSSCLASFTAFVFSLGPCEVQEAICVRQASEVSAKKSCRRAKMEGEPKGCCLLGVPGKHPQERVVSKKRQLQEESQYSVAQLQGSDGRGDAEIPRVLLFRRYNKGVA